MRVYVCARAQTIFKRLNKIIHKNAFHNVSVKLIGPFNLQIKFRLSLIQLKYEREHGTK